MPYSGEWGYLSPLRTRNRIASVMTVHNIELSPEAFAERAAYLTDAAKLKAPPTVPIDVARLCGVDDVIVSSNLSVSGQLVWNGRALFIQLNSNESPERRNFTCCHEIAHTFSFDGSAKFRSAHHDRELQCAPATAREESLCDLAASELLLPGKFFIPAARRLPPSIRAVTTLAKTFGASFRATMRRIGETAVWPVVFVIWQQLRNPKPGAELGVAWVVAPAGAPYSVPRYAPAARASGMYATFISGISTIEREVLKLGNIRGCFDVESAKLGRFVISIVHDARLEGRTRNAG
jgi:hypothetical protein